MKTLLAAVVAAAALAGTAQAATPEQRIAALEQQVAALAGPQQTPADRKIAALTRRVTTLERKLKTAETSLNQARNLAGFAIAYTVCLTATTADAFSGTWNVIDQIATTAQAKTYFTPQAAVSDVESCRALELTRTPAVPPTLSPFSALTALLT